MSFNVLKTFPIFLKLTTLNKNNLTEKHHRKKWGGRGEAEQVRKEMLEVSTSLHGSSAGVFQGFDSSNSPKIF